MLAAAAYAALTKEVLGGVQRERHKTGHSR